jgi:hypothetical protein
VEDLELATESARGLTRVIAFFVVFGFWILDSSTEVAVRVRLRLARKRKSCDVGGKSELGG